VLYVATGIPVDAEMAERIALHRAQRSPNWRTLELPMASSVQVADELGDATTVIVEDLGLLLSNAMAHDAAGAEPLVDRELNGLLALPANLIMVSNEVGMGIVPPYPLGRVFRDALGRLNQRAAAACGEAYLLVAGLPLRLK
jgi:adenosylcobinamide kinase/adenosylcobinamide-phosphate guanylyltransferase